MSSSDNESDYESDYESEVKENTNTTSVPKPTSFRVFITPQVTLNELIDAPYYKKNYELEAGIDSSWFEQTLITQNDSTNTTELMVDFTVRDTYSEIDDCFLTDLLWVIEDLGKKTKRKFVVNSETLTYGYDHDDGPKVFSCCVNNNKIFTETLDVKTDTKYIIPDPFVQIGKDFKQLISQMTSNK